MKRIIVILSLLCSSAALAATTIQGNPIGRQDDYTINTSSRNFVSLTCVFTNTGKDPAKLQVWTTPHDPKPVKSIYLKPASKSKPYRITAHFRLPLKNHWWCLIYTPHNQKDKWKYCTFFSITDATIPEYKPFGNFDKTVHSKDTSYECKIRNPKGTISFFSFI